MTGKEDVIKYTIMRMKGLKFEVFEVLRVWSI